MNYKRVILVSILLVFSAVGCQDQEVVIGDGPPNQEFGKCLKLLEKKDYEEAVQCLEMFKAKYPRSEEATLAELKIGDAYLKQKDYLLAADSYDVFLKVYPYSPRAGYAHYKAGLAYSKEAPGPIDRDQKYLYQAEQHLKMAAVMPGAYQEEALKALGSVQDRIVKRHFYIGKFYYKKKQYVACRPRFRNVVNMNPDSKLAPRSLYYLVRSSIGIKEIEDARSYFTLLNDQYPISRWTKKARNRLLEASKKEDG